MIRITGINAIVHYSVTVNGQHMWSGQLPFDMLHTLRDAKRNSAYAQHIKPEHVLTITIGDEPFPPGWCNVNGQDIATTAKRVKCLTDEREFDNAARACEHYGIASSAMSNHLNGKKHYQTVGGHTFRRI